MTGSNKVTKKTQVPDKKNIKTIAPTMEKTKYKYTHKSADGKSKKLPIYKTAKGKYVVFVNDKKKYLDMNKLMKGGATTVNIIVNNLYDDLRKLIQDPIHQSFSTVNRDYEEIKDLQKTIVTYGCEKAKIKKAQEDVQNQIASTTTIDGIQNLTSNLTKNQNEIFERIKTKINNMIIKKKLNIQHYILHKEMVILYHNKPILYLDTQEPLNGASLAFSLLLDLKHFYRELNNLNPLHKDRYSANNVKVGDVSSPNNKKINTELKNTLKETFELFDHTYLAINNDYLETNDLNGYEISKSNNTFTITLYLSEIVCNTNSNCNPKCSKQIKH